MQNALLKDYTTFQLGGPCKILVACKTPEEITSVVQSLNRVQEKFILIGGGSNLVVSDSGIPCVVIRYLNPTPEIEHKGTVLTVSGSTILDHLAQYTVEHGLEGLEYTSGIPGTVGGAVVGNAGAWGKQVGDVLIEATLLSVSGQTRVANTEDLQFTYRNSNLKETGEIVLSVKFRVNPASAEILKAKREEILKLRQEKHPDLQKEPCAGSFFRNIEPTSQAGKRQAAGWFLEQAGGKSLSYGGAKIFDKHANIIIKSTNCKSQDVYELHLLMKKLAREKFNLDLTREVRFVGNFQGMPDNAPIIW